jgi:DNA-binding MarR family transcriptional regulator
MAGDTEALKEAIGLAVRRFTADVSLFNQDVAARLAVGPNEARLVTLLQMHGPLTPGGLAEVSGLSSRAVGAAVTGLVKAGYASRDRDETNRRRVVVTLDQELIARKLDDLCAPRLDRLGSALDRFNREELWTIADFLSRLVPAPQGTTTQ